MKGKSFIHHTQNMFTTLLEEKRKMVKCKNCGAEVASPRKSWKMAGRPDKAGKKTQLTIGLFDCPSCNKSFKVVLNKQKI
jgi:Zn finger protein HypA/HybF involved in hydrogenase expression